MTLAPSEPREYYVKKTQSILLVSLNTLEACTSKGIICYVF
jgi:hypothetical protein